MPVLPKIFRHTLLTGTSALALTLAVPAMLLVAEAPLLAQTETIVTDTILTGARNSIVFEDDHLTIAATSTIIGEVSVPAGINAITVENHGVIQQNVISYGQDIHISGNLGTLTNSGALSGSGLVFYNIFVNGTVNTLINTGPLSLLATCWGGGIMIANDPMTLINSGDIEVVRDIDPSILPSTLTNLENIPIFGIGVIGHDSSLAELNNSGNVGVSGNYAIAIGIVDGIVDTLSNEGYIVAQGTNVIGVGALGSLGTLSNNGNILVQGTIAVGVGVLDVTLPSTIVSALSTLGPTPFPTLSSTLTGELDFLINNGLIGVSGLYAIGVGVAGGTLGVLSNNGTISVLGQDAFGVGVLGSLATLNNFGTISASGTIALGVGVAGYTFPSTFLDYLSSTIGFSPSAVLDGNLELLINSGEILAQGNYAVGVAVMNGRIGTLSNSGTISANGTLAFGVGVLGTIDTLTNTGLITASGTLASGVAILGTVLSIQAFDPSLSLLTSNGTIFVPRGILGTLDNQGTISAMTALWINQSGTLGSLTNSGLMSGDKSGIGNSGVLSGLTNSGTITGTLWGINNDSTGTLSSLNNIGFISSLNNRGTIRSEGGPAIYNSGLFGLITNSGLILGDIVNTSANPLTLSGGTGSIFGTFSGGTLSNSGSNLVFSSGNILLLDDVDVGGNSLINQGATLRLIDGRTIHGAYTQSGGQLVINVTSSSVYGNLLVVGNASITNTSITLLGNLSSGENLTIVHPTGSGTYLNDLLSVGGNPQLNVSIVSGTGSDMVVMLTSNASNSYQHQGAMDSGTGGVMGGVLDNIATATTDTATLFKSEVLTKIDALPTADARAAAIRQLAPTQNAPAFQMATTASAAVLGAVEQHQQTAMAFDAHRVWPPVLKVMTPPFGARFWGEPRFAPVPPKPMAVRPTILVWPLASMTG